MILWILDHFSIDHLLLLTAFTGCYFYWLDLVDLSHLNLNSDLEIWWTHFISTTQQTLTRILEICYLADSTQLNYSARSTHLDSGFWNLLHILATLSWIIITGMWKYFYIFFSNLTQNLKVSYRFWKIKIFCFIDSTI